jgi:hypothetical protein
MKESVCVSLTVRPAIKAGLMLNKGRCSWSTKPILVRNL